VPGVQSAHPSGWSRVSSLTFMCLCRRLRMNKLNALPRGFGAFPALEVLDLTYNNLTENSLPGNFFGLSMSVISCNCICCKCCILENGFETLSEFPVCVAETMQALYLGDADFETLNEFPVCVAETLRALYLGDNDFETLPADIGKLINLQIVSVPRLILRCSIVVCWPVSFCFSIFSTDTD